MKKTTSLTKTVQNKKNVRQRKSPAEVSMRARINAKLKLDWDADLCRGAYHDKMHVFQPDLFEDEIRAFISDNWDSHTDRANAFAMSCDVAKRRYIYVNKIKKKPKQKIDLTNNSASADSESAGVDASAEAASFQGSQSPGSPVKSVRLIVLN